MNNRISVALIIALLVFAGFFIYKSTIGSSNLDKIPEGLSIETDKQANIVNGKELLSSLGSLESYNYLSEDLYVFAKSAYPAYKNNETELVGFDVDSKVLVDGNDVKVEGRFGAVNNRISVNISVLKNNRVKTSITDTATELNIDKFLPSNSKRNLFIGSLSISTSAYAIDYDEINGGFTISLYSESESEIDAAYDEAEKAILSGLGVKSLDNEVINIQRPSSSFGY